MPKPNLLLAALFFILCGSVILFSCNKTEAPDIDFSVSGLNNTDLSENGHKELVLNVAHTKGSSEQVTLGIEGLPPGVSADFNVQTALPSFETTLHLKDDSSAGGVHEVTVTATSASGIVHPYTFKLTTHEKTCAQKLSAIYLCTITFANGGGRIYNNIQVSEDSKVKNRLNYRWGDHLMHIDVNCNTNKVIMPLQYIDKGYVKGEGYVDQNYSVIRVNYAEYHDNGEKVSGIAYFQQQ